MVLKQSLGDAGVQDLAAATLMRGSTTDDGPVRPVDRGVHHSVVEAVVAVSDAENVTSVSSVADESQSLSCAHGKPPRHMLCYSTSFILSYVCLSVPSVCTLQGKRRVISAKVRRDIVPRCALTLR